MDHGRVVELPNPGLHRPQPNHFHRPITEFGFRRHNGFGFALNSGFGFCGFFGGLGTHNVFGDDFSCLSFFFDPFFAGGVPTPSGDDSTTQGSEQDQPIAADASAEDAAQDVMVEDDPPKPVDRVPHHRRSPREPDTLLQLKDGSMYGLRDYWEEGGRLYYLTNYGGGNSVPLAQIDLPRTQQLNAERGEKFVLAPVRGD